MDDDIAISAHNLAKRYRLFRHPGDRIKQFLSLGLRRYHREFTALQEASFEIRKGETIGIIGRNGSGKSTLLQVICGILKPTTGTVRVHGRISCLLELGAGFNPEFTGRENAYFQGALMGFTSSQMDERIDTIAAFADIGEFIDQPVRVYSSGMFVRLAFAVASHVDPDIMVVDEALAVGDAAFQQKCFARIYDMQARGMTMIIVSHNPYQIERLCNRVTVMNKGRLSPLYPAKEAFSLYQELVHGELAPCPGTEPSLREGTHALVFERVWIEGGRDPADGAFRTNEPLRIVANIVAESTVSDVRFRFELCSGSDLVTMISTIGLTEETRFFGRHRIAFTMPHCQLTTGWYHINAIAVGRNVRLDAWPRAAEFSVLLKDETARNQTGDSGIYVCQGHWEIS
ncbi:MAG: ATP-binding cassette domain-containing protein [Dechloromonas sp.]|nr:MAG: ATP-binding cassette domain-containing protein [Dechloromonas sp.]